MVVSGLVSRDIRNLFRRAKRPVVPQAIELVHLYRTITEKWEREEKADWPKRKKLSNEVVKEIAKVITTGVPLELTSFDRWMRDLPDDEVEVFAAFRAKIHNSSKIEAEKTAKWTKAVRKRDVILQVLKFENTIDIEVRHVQPRLGRDIDAPHLYKVGECMMHDTFDIVLLRWIMQDKAISLRSNPHFYDNLEHPGYRVSERRDALVFSKTLSDYGATRKRAETERIIIHCITDAHNHPLILFKHIAGWRFGQLCRFKDVILLKGTSGLLVEVTWFQDQLDQAVSLKITKRERSRETASLSVSWETLLDEVIKARRRDTQFTWIIENDAGDLLKKDSPKSIYLTVSAEGLGSSRQTLVPFNAQSKISLVPSEMTLVSPPDAESLPSKFRRSVDAFGSPNLQDPRRGDASPMPPGTLANIQTPHSDIPVAPGGEELPYGESTLVPQKSGDDIVTTGPIPPSPIPADIIHNQDSAPADDAGLSSTNVQQPSESDGAVRPSLKPDDTSRPLSEATLNTDRSPESPLESPQELKGKGWLAKAKEFIVNLYS